MNGTMLQGVVPQTLFICEQCQCPGRGGGGGGGGGWGVALFTPTTVQPAENGMLIRVNRLLTTIINQVAVSVAVQWYSQLAIEYLC